MDASAALLNTVASSVSTLTAIVCEAVVIWVVAAVVKRHRPDAYGKLLAWAITSLAATIVVSASYTFVGPLAEAVARSENALFVVLAVISFARTAMEVVLVVLLVRGLVALAQPPKPVVVQSDTPYR